MAMEVGDGTEVEGRARVRSATNGGGKRNLTNKRSNKHRMSSMARINNDRKRPLARDSSIGVRVPLELVLWVGVVCGIQ